MLKEVHNAVVCRNWRVRALDHVGLGADAASWATDQGRTVHCVGLQREGHSPKRIGEFADDYSAEQGSLACAEKWRGVEDKVLYTSIQDVCIHAALAIYSSQN